jgi:hypothetical protein
MCPLAKLVAPKRKGDNCGTTTVSEVAENDCLPSNFTPENSVAQTFDATSKLCLLKRVKAVIHHPPTLRSKILCVEQIANKGKGGKADASA